MSATATKIITGQWGSLENSRFVPDSEPVALEFRETAKFYYVTLPSGRIKPCRKFNNLGQPKSLWGEYFGHQPRRKIRFVLSETL